MARDIRDHLAGKRHRRGLLTGLALVLAGGVALVAGEPLMAALASDRAPAPGPEMAAEIAAAGVTSAASGRLTGRRMAPGNAVTRLAEAPVRPFRELIATVGETGGLDATLRRAGVPRADAKAASAAIRAAAGGDEVRAGTRIDVRLGSANPDGVRPLERLALKPRFDLRVALVRTASGAFSVRREAIAVKAEPLRLRGDVGAGLYWALRGAGVSPGAAQDYLEAVASQIDVGEISGGDRFDLVIEQRATAEGERVAGPLLYAGLDRATGRDVQLLRWRAGGREQWLDPEALDGDAEGMIWPVSARISSAFGMRRHPILRYRRMHAGVDFAATHGTPIRAAADGRVTRAAWAGGYGRQVRIAHDGGIVTSYSHMSGFAVPDGASVRQGQVIGYVGTSGLSTGAHLHYEVRVNGRAVDPHGVQLVRAPTLDPAARAAFRSRFEQYRTLPARGSVG